MLRTKALVDKMGVPTYQRTTELEDGTVILTLIEKGEEYIFIDSPFPEVHEVVVEEQEEEEEEYKCHPGFTVYRNLVIGKENLNYGAEARPYDDGELLSYNDKKRQWYVNEDIESYNHDSGQVAWFGLKANLKKQVYYDDTGLDECNLISWKAEHGGVCATYFKTNYSKNIFFQGRTISMSHYTMVEYMNVIGACLLPSSYEEKDYFYAIHCDFGNSYGNWNPISSASGIAFTITRRERNPKVLVGGDPAALGSTEIVGYVMGDDLLAASGGANLVHAICPAIHIDEEGIAYIGTSVSYPYQSEPTGICDYWWQFAKGPPHIDLVSSEDGGYSGGKLYDKTGENSPSVYARLAIRLKDAKVLSLDVPYFDENLSPQWSQSASSSIDSWPVVGDTRYGCRRVEIGTGQSGNPCGFTVYFQIPGVENDMVRFQNPEGLPYIERVKTLDQVRQIIQGAGAGSTEISFPSRPVPIYGFGCPEGYFEYSLKASPMIDTWSKTMKGGPDKTMTNADYDPTETNQASYKKVKSIPLYEKTVEGQGNCSGAQVYLICTNVHTGEEVLNMQVADMTGYGDSGWWSLTKNSGLQFGYGKPNLGQTGAWYGYDYWYEIPDPWDLGRGTGISWNSENVLGRMYGGITGFNYRTWAKRLMWHHPMVPDLVGYIERSDDVTVNGASGTSTRPFSVVTTDKYVFDGKTIWTHIANPVFGSGAGSGIATTVSSYGPGIGFGNDGSYLEECYSSTGGNHSVGVARSERMYRIIGLFDSWKVDYGEAMNDHTNALLPFTGCDPKYHVHHHFVGTTGQDWSWSGADPNYLYPYNYYFVSKRYTSTTSGSYDYYFRAHFTFHNMKVDTMKNKWGAKYAFIGYVPQPLEESLNYTPGERGFTINWYKPEVMLPGKTSIHYFVSNVFDDVDTIANLPAEGRTAGQKLDFQGEPYDRVDKDYPLDFGVI